MKLRLVTLALIVALMGLFVAVPMGAAAAPPTSGGTATLINPTTGAVLGTVTNLVATVDQAGNVLLSGTFTDAVTSIVTNFANVPLLAASGTCDILHLTLGPLDLNLLGLVVHLDRVMLDITAQAGPGNLLGNLLCAVAHLLDSNAAGTAIANLLNRIFSLL